MRGVGVLLLAAAMLIVASAHAKKIYKIVDADGITHYTDRKPDAGVEATIIPVRAERQQIARLRLEGIDRERRAVVSNLLAGAIEVELRFTANSNIQGDPSLPLRVVIPASAERSQMSLGGQSRVSLRLSLSGGSRLGNAPGNARFRRRIASRRTRFKASFTRWASRSTKRD